MILLSIARRPQVLPVTEAMLYGTVDAAVHTAEQDWSAPRPSKGPRGGGWGAQRTVLFSGLRWAVRGLGGDRGLRMPPPLAKVLAHPSISDFHISPSASSMTSRPLPRPRQRHPCKPAACASS